MSINNLQMQYAIRTRLLTMEVATTGSISLAANSSGFVRTTGSFITDGFEPGMELAATGFSQASNNANWVITYVEALTLHVSGLSGATAASGRTLTVGLPSGRAYENEDFTPVSGEPYFEEQYLSGPSSQLTNGTDGATIQVDPLYVAMLFVPENNGMAAPNRYADAILTVFKPNSTFNLTNGNALRVRTDTGPFRGQMTRRKPGWVVVPVTIPLRLYTLNQ